MRKPGWNARLLSFVVDGTSHLLLNNKAAFLGEIRPHWNKWILKLFVSQFEEFCRSSPRGSRTISWQKIVIAFQFWGRISVQVNYHRAADEDASSLTLNNNQEEPINVDDDEDSISKASWTARLLKSASGVLSHRRDSSSEASEPRLQQQCVEGGGEAEDEEQNCCQATLDDETYPSTSVSTSMQTSNSINLDHLTIHQRLMLALSLMVILHAMIANLWTSEII